MTAVALPATRTRGRRFRWNVGVLAAPVAVWLLFFFVAPFVVILWYSFGDKPSLYITHDNSVLSLGRYVEAFNPTFVTVFLRTLQISVVGTILCLVIAFPMAYWMAVKLPARFQGIAVALVLVPYWTNFLVRTIGWQIVLSPTSFLADASRALGLGTPQLLYTTGAVQLGVVYNYLPLMILPLYVTLERLDPRLLEASRDLGANAFESFRRVTLPIVLPGVAAGLLLVFVPLMGDYITPSVLGGAAGSMVGQQVASQFNVAQNWALGSAMAIVLMVAIIAVVVLFALLFRLVKAIIDRFEHVAIVEGEA
ncbi:ABC transporter permease [Amnibacterium kyonggiense]|uniref:Spermidine/putrescine transport system permease protein n=1 Tax=Amnibacterium kyonggiense TaxID=595671 RepID=A0A4R7FSU5_9MICO|nr:ABC transporter permease [Amnibacterium kyonggiense]TDS80876.1 spermidine/putrescine transport system permease protein [Amnibacterium kyonggiense]